MRWASLVVGMAVALTCLAAGCAATDIAGLLFFRTNPATGDRVLEGSLEEVANSTQQSLSSLGLKATVTPQGEAYYIDSQTRDGARFRLVLTHVQSPAGEKTRVKLEWVDNRQDSVGVQVLTEVEKTHKGT